MKRNLLLPLFVVLFLLACQTSEEEKIRQVLQQRQGALINKDLSLYLSCISKAYQDKEEDFDHLQKRVESYFQDFDRIDYQNWNLSIHREGGTAIVTQEFQLKVERKGKANGYSGKEAIIFRKESGKWKIVKGL
jgi:ketosteroid isomerase-like protein